MQLRLLAALLLVFVFHRAAPAAESARERPLDDNWAFYRGDVAGAEAPDFDDSSWRRLDVPHDWSIEDLPPTPPATTAEEKTPLRVGPFAPDESPSKHFTAHTLGGIGWYRKTFSIEEPGRVVTVRFDGVYMNAEFWLNGHRLGEHPHGYTPVDLDLTPHLRAPGQSNVLAVRVRNEGRNSRWYSGSGIYRHVSLEITGPIHVPPGGLFVTTPAVAAERALVKCAVEVRNTSTAAAAIHLRARVRDAAGRIVGTAEGLLHVVAGETRHTELFVSLERPALWSPESPVLHRAEVEILRGDEVADTASTTFGVRSLSFDAVAGFRLNGVPLELRGGCIHHDNGPLGAAAIPRAEERKIELLLASGFNAIRTSHNPPSSALLDACDRLGMLVIDEAFDQWTRSKERNEQDYHRFFNDWAERDLAAMIRRDRNHPSVIMWSVGNEIPEQFRAEPSGQRLRAAVLAHDSTRAVTQAICTDWGQVIKDWDARSDPAFTHLDVAGYNYLPEKYEGDHRRHPERVMYGSETFPKDALVCWQAVEKHAYVVGDFVWTAVDYLGEAGLAHSILSNEKDSFFMPWPWFNAWSGDIDLTGHKKPQSLYRDVVWRRSQIELLVHTPIPPGLNETLSWWAWPDEHASWNWSGHEGTPLQVNVYSRCDTVRLELNGRVIGEQPVSEATRLTTRFDVPYAAGELRAVGLVAGRVVAETRLTTTGAPARLRLTSDRTVLRNDRDDLAHVTIEVVDAQGRVVPDAALPLRLTTSGAGELAGHINAHPSRPASFRGAERDTWQGRALAILRPLGRDHPGTLTFRVEAPGLPPAELVLPIGTQP